MHHKPKPNSRPEPKLQLLHTHCPLHLAFAVDGLLPVCSLSAIASAPGQEAGRSSLASILAAATHPPFYQDSPDPTVLFVAPFTDLQFQLRPRLDQLGVNPQRIRVFESVHEPDADYPRRPFTIHDLAHLRSELSAHNTYRLLIIDNAELFFDLAARPSRAKILRQLYQLHDLAYTHQLAVVLLVSLPAYKPHPFTTTFLSAVSEVCRTNYILASDPHLPQQHYLFTYKNTLAFTTPTRQLAILPNPVLPNSAPQTPAV